MNDPKVYVVGAILLLALLMIPLQNALKSPPDDLWFQARVVNQPTPVLVKFGADWCGPCLAMQPELDRLKSRYSGRLAIVEIDIDERPHLADHYSVSGIPRLILFENGRIRKSRTGFGSGEELADWVERSL